MIVSGEKTVQVVTLSDALLFIDVCLETFWQSFNSSCQPCLSLFFTVCLCPKLSHSLNVFSHHTTKKAFTTPPRNRSHSYFPSLKDFKGSCATLLSVHCWIVMVQKQGTKMDPGILCNSGNLYLAQLPNRKLCNTVKHTHRQRIPNSKLGK